MSEIRKRRVFFKLTKGGEFMPGWFHIWGLDAMEFDNGCSNWTVAVVEDDGGGVHLVHPENLQFKK